MVSNGQYYEVQKFRQRWLMAVLISVMAISIVTPFLALSKASFEPYSLIPFAIALLIFLLFRRMKLILQIDDEKICYRFYPLQIREAMVRRLEIKDISVVKYNPILDYGGWGIRFGRNGKAYTVSGKFGVRINRVNRKTLLIGTCDPARLFQFLEQHHYNPINLL